MTLKSYIHSDALFNHFVCGFIIFFSLSSKIVRTKEKKKKKKQTFPFKWIDVETMQTMNYTSILGFDKIQFKSSLWRTIRKVWSSGSRKYDERKKKKIWENKPLFTYHHLTPRNLLTWKRCQIVAEKLRNFPFFFPFSADPFTFL